jgi:putative glutathione S-transferase
MGLLVEGQWRDQWYDTASSGGRFVRKDSTFREWVIAEEDLKERGGSRSNQLRVAIRAYANCRHATRWAPTGSVGFHSTDVE